MCTAGCFGPPFSITCTANCAAQGCADVQYLVDQAINCMYPHVDECGWQDLGCHAKYCPTEFAACIAAKCDQ